MSRIHMFSFMASATVMFFLRLCLKSIGNRVAGDVPLTKLEVQNFALRPLRTDTLVTAVKRAWSRSSTGSSMPRQGRFGSLHSHRNQRSRRAFIDGGVNLSRSLSVSVCARARRLLSGS